MASADPPEPLSPSSPSRGTCWECDARKEELVRVPLPLPAGKHVTITLCADCYDTRYVTLLRELADHPNECPG